MTQPGRRCHVLLIPIELQSWVYTRCLKMFWQVIGVIGFFMKRKSDKKGSQSGPTDRSLEAYKTWFMEITKRLTKEGTEIKLTEEEWIASWKDYWEEKSSS